MTTPKIPSAAMQPPAPDEEEDLSIEYPSGDGEPMADNDWQWIAMADTAFTLRNRYAGRTDVYVASDMLLYYRMNDVSARVAPDVYVAFGANGNHRRMSWLTWREGKVPDFVLEVASPRTWERDAGDKRDIYAAMGVTEYWRFDPRGDFFVPELIGEELTDGEYRPLPLHTDADGILRGHSALLGLDICVRPRLELRLYDPAAGQWLLAPEESYAAHRASEAARLSAEEARSSAEEARSSAEAAQLSAEAAHQAAAEALQEAEEENRRLREQLRQLQSGQ